MEKFSLPRMHELCLMQVRADRAMRTMIVIKLEAHKLTMMEWLALGVVSAGSKQGLSMSEIAAMLDVTLPQVTALVADLLELKFVKQKILASDHRGRQVIITLKGKHVLSKLERVIAREVHDWIKQIPSGRLQAYVSTVEQLSGQAD